MIRAWTNTRASAFTLIEAIVVVVIIGVTVPPIMFALDRSVQRQQSAVTSIQTSALMQMLLDKVLADAASPVIGVDFITGVPTYWKNLTSSYLPSLSLYEDLGYAWELTVDDGIAPDGTIGSPDPLTNPFVLVTVKIKPPNGGELQYGSVLLMER